jgi:hypothetical protein
MPVLSRDRLGTWLRALRPHWIFVVIVAAGTTLRALAWAAYQPALFYSDSANYLANTYRVPNTAWHPLGYPVFLDALLPGHHIAVVTAVQHLMAIADAVAIYVLLLHLRCGRVVATLAATPVLLDAYQVQIEQYILSETLFESLLVAALVVALWPSRDRGVRLGITRTAVVAALMGLGVLVRLDALGLVVPLAGWLLWSAWRQRGTRVWRPVLAAGVAFTIPLVVLLGLRGASGNGASITGTGPIWLYGRVATFANCPADHIPASERAMCPTQPLGHRPGAIWFQNSGSAPEWQFLDKHPGDTAPIEAFARRVIEHQPLDYAQAVGSDFVQQFRPTRAQNPNGPEVVSWQFRLTLTPVDPTKPVPQAMVDRYGTGKATLDLGVARVLRHYQHYGYLPGPVNAAMLVLSVIALVVRRRHRLAPALFLVAACGVVTVLTATATVLFSWRYVLPTLFLYPPAGAIAWTMLRNREATTIPA